MNSHSLAVQEADCSDQNSLDGIPSDMLNGMTTANGSSQPESKTDSCPTPLYSAISEHSLIRDVRSFTEGLRMLSQGDSPASRSVSPENRREPKTKGICGRRQKMLSESCNLDMSCSKTSPVSLGYPIAILDNGIWITPQKTIFGILEPYSQTWPKSGLMRDGQCWGLTMSAHRIGENGSGLWPTITRRDYRNSSDRKRNSQGPDLIGYLCRITGESGIRLKPSFAEEFMGWPVGWTDLKPLATGKFQQWLEQHGRF